MPGALILPFTEELELVIAADNSGAIGEKEADVVKTSNQLVGQFACRVAVMECLAASGEPQAVIMQNFTGDAAWREYEIGVREVLREAGLDSLPVTGSTESNFPGLQSALGLTVIGLRKKQARIRFTGKEAFAVIGTPHVGGEVLEHLHELPSPLLLKKFTEEPGIVGVLPAGSKGIQHDYERWTGRKDEWMSSLDLKKSAGPATCFLIAFQPENRERVQQLGGRFFHSLDIRKIEEE